MIIAFICILLVIGQTTQPTVDILRIISDASGPALLAVIVYGAIKEWWVPGKTHKRMVNERDQLLKMVLRGTTVTERTVKAAELVIDSSESRDNA